MRFKKIVWFNRLAADLGVEVETAGSESAGLEDVITGKRHLRDIHRELVGVPAEKIVAAIDVDRAEDAEGGCEREFVLEGVTGQDRVILLDIDLHLIFEAELLEHPEYRADVEIILVLCRLFRLRLNEDSALEADLVFVLDHHVEEAAKLRQLASHVGVE